MLSLISIALYLTATALQWRHLAQTEHASRNGAAIVAICALLTHAAALWPVLASQGLHQLTLLPTLALVGLALAFAVLVLSTRQPLHSLKLVVYPLAALSLASWSLMPATAKPPVSVVPGIGLHAGLSLAAWTFLMLAALQACAIYLQDHALRNPSRRLAALRMLPPLQTTEALMFELIWVGMALLTLAILSGSLYVTDLLAQHLAHKTILTALSWLLFAALLIGRYMAGWRGIRAARLTVYATLLLALAFLGTRFVLEVLLQRSPVA